MSTSLVTSVPTTNFELKENKTYTCLACEVAFPTSDRQRTHYRTDWHKYNLKRKLANLTAVSAEQFTQKVLAQQERNRQVEEKQGLIYECTACKKSYYSENAYNNHITSKKHLEKAESEETVKEDTDMTTTTNKPVNPTLDCLFCTHESQDLESNLQHMTQKHSFFLPDAEYLVDTEGLIKYLSEKINTSHLCLYCNGRGKEYSSASAVRAHMVDSGHCKMAYDETEDPQELLKYYDFQLDDAMDIDETPSNSDELVLESGAKAGHRKFLQHYKKHQARKPLAPAVQEEPEQVPLESLRRKERRHLAITDGKEQDMKNTADGIREAAKREAFAKKLSLKQNENTLFRFRTSNPI